MDRSRPMVSSKSSPRRLITIAPFTAGAHTIGPSTIAHGLGESGEVTRPHGDRVRAVHASQAQESGRLCDAMGVGLIVVGDGQDGMGGALVDALDAARRVPVEDRGVLRVGYARRRGDQGVKLHILGAAFDGVHLLPRELEVRAQFDEGDDLPAGGLDVGERRFAERLPASGVHPSGGGAKRPLEVHELPASELQLEDAGGFRVDLLPRGRREGRELSLEVVHRLCPPLRLPMPREPPPSPAPSPPPSPPPVLACSRAMSEPVVKRYSLRCASILASRRRYHSRTMAKCSFSSSRLWARISFRSGSLVASTR